MDKQAGLWYSHGEVIDMAKADDRFVRVYEQGSFTNIFILADKETGVQYLATQQGEGLGLTPLLNTDGTPSLAKFPIEGLDEKKKKEKWEKKGINPWA